MLTLSQMQKVGEDDGLNKQHLFMMVVNYVSCGTFLQDISSMK